jgi:tRNA nucleotidyltransferase (CCA-adding enzyme)
MTVSPHDSVDRVRDLTIQTGWGQIPVALDGHITGIVTRTDMIQLQPSSQTTERQKIAHLLEESTPEPLLTLIREIGAEAAEAGYAIYFVGGLVRDLLLGHSIVDVDLVVEGDAIELGHTMAAAYGGEIRSHKRFGTSKWLLPDDIWDVVRARRQHNGDWRQDAGHDRPHRDRNKLPHFIDLVTARTEFYEHPTALPMVSRSSIKQDLHRRDFTINTLAIRLDPQRWGEMLDFYGGRSDLKDGVIRVLHSLSLIDDPTRILRAARFEARLGFRIHERSEALIAEAIPLLDRVTGERIRHEFDLIFLEATPPAVLDRLQMMGALRQIHPDLTSDAWLAARLSLLIEAFDPGIWDLSDHLNDFRWALFLYRLDQQAIEQVHKRLKLSTRLRELLNSQEVIHKVLSNFCDEEKASVITTRLDELPLHGLALAWLAMDSSRMRHLLEHYASEWRYVQPELNGDDLKQLGFKPGPIFRDILSYLKEVRLDGITTNRADEIALVEASFVPENGS